MTETINSIEALEALYGSPVPVSLTKVASHITPLYKQWIESSRFVVVSTVGPEGTDGSPRGDVDPVVRISDDKTVLLPDWQGNNRMDSLRNIVRDGRISLMFMVPGCNNVVRLNGTAVLGASAELTEQFKQSGKHPKTVIIITVGEVYFQCAKALMRSALWAPTEKNTALPTAGEFIKEMEADFDAHTYDADYPERAKTRMW